MPSAKKADDLSLLEKYYREEFKDMLLFAVRMLNSEELAEVSVQDTFVIALEKIASLKASTNPVGWLYNTLKNVIRHMRRDQQAQLLRVVSIDDIPELPASDKEADLLLIASSGKDPDIRILIEFYVEGRSLKELAEEYRVSVGACKMRIKRARERSRAILDLL